MPATFLSRVQGFTPVIDVVAEELGLAPAAVYGVVWRYCQGPRGVCQASLETIAAHLGIDRRTALRHVKALVAAGYLEDLTPNLRNRPHTYADSGKAEILGLVEARVLRHERGEAAPHSAGAGGVTNCHTQECQNVTPPGARSDKLSPRGVTNCHLKIQREEEGERTEETDAFTPAMDLQAAIPDAARLWAAAREALRAPLSPDAWSTWLADSHAISLEDHVLVIGVRSAYVKDWLENRLYGLVQRTVAEAAGRATSVRFIVRRNTR